MRELERRLRPLLQPVARNGGEYLRPWMTNGAQPEQCRIWVVGANPAKTFPASQVGSPDVYLDALFVRNGRSMRALYDDITCGQPSPTRRNLDRVNSALSASGLGDVLETNVNCYPTRMSADLDAPSRREGRERGRELLCVMLEMMQPEVVWLHGAGAIKTYRREHLPTLPDRLAGQDWTMHEADRRIHILTASLALPAFNMWCRNLDRVLSEVCDALMARAPL